MKQFVTRAIVRKSVWKFRLRPDRKEEKKNSSRNMFLYFNSFLNMCSQCSTTNTSTYNKQIDTRNATIQIRIPKSQQHSIQLNYSRTVTYGHGLWLLAPAVAVFIIRQALAKADGRKNIFICNITGCSWIQMEGAHIHSYTHTYIYMLIHLNASILSLAVF
jgi:hypothetical protein